MSKKKRESGLWTYIQSLGILEQGSPEEIAAAKKAYWKTYHQQHRRTQREEKPEFLVALDRADGTYNTISIGAKRHTLTIPAFLRTATLAYLTQAYVVPNHEYIAHLEQLLSQCSNEIAALAGSKDKYFWQRDQKIEAIEQRIERLEREVSELFRNPPTLETTVRKAIQQSPEIKERLLTLLSSL
ncbi:MAG: hypothetical protein ABIQ40_18700 [Bacteroidia bacterium]